MNCLRRTLPAPSPELLRCALLGVVSALSGCSVVLSPGEEQCSVDADCEARGAQFSGTVCVEHVCVEDPPSMEPTR